MASIGEIWLTEFGNRFPGEPSFRRPALVVGPVAGFGSRFPFAVVLPITTAHRGLNLHVPLAVDPASGLDRDSYVQCELIRSVNRRRLIRQLGTADPVALDKADRVVRDLLGH